jgi:Fe-S-cluster containining protein
MSLPVRTLPIDERWDCHGCGRCCRGTIIELDADDLRRLRSQRWDEHPDYRGQAIVVRGGLLRRRDHLAKRPDGSCIFLMADGRCRIHREFGMEAKPLVCQMFPLQIVPLDQFAYVTLRRFCPSAAADQGRPLDEHRATARDLVERWQSRPRPATPPPLVRRRRSSWNDVLVVAEALGRLMLDATYPLVRRLVHALEFCDLLESCRLARLEGSRLVELASMLEAAAVREAGYLFQNRQAPDPRTARLFRQAMFEYLSLHPRYTPDDSWKARWRLLAEAARFHRGSGKASRHGLPFSLATFDSLERPLGPLGEAVLRPLNRWFEAAVASQRFSLLARRRWPVVESFRAMALGFPVAMWTLRLACEGRAPEVDDAIEVVAMLDRGETYAPLVGRRHQLRLAAMSRRAGLARLAAWYAR